MISLRWTEGISDEEIYSDRISYAKSEKLKSFQLSHDVAWGISSGMYRPPSVAKPRKTTSSNEH